MTDSQNQRTKALTLAYSLIRIRIRMRRRTCAAWILLALFFFLQLGIWRFYKHRTYSQTVYNTKGTCAHMHRELIRECGGHKTKKHSHITGILTYSYSYSSSSMRLRRYEPSCTAGLGCTRTACARRTSSRNASSDIPSGLAVAKSSSSTLASIAFSSVHMKGVL